MQITASMVKELRERTGAGMMDCKKALQETDGNIETAIEEMRKSGVAKAAKKAGRIAAEGIILIKQASDLSLAAIIEVNCETDFVAKDDNFQAFANASADCVLANRPADIDALNSLTLEDGKTVEDTRLELISKIGENVSIRRFELFQKQGENLGSYVHGNRIGVLVDMSEGDSGLVRDIAMHVAASRPVCVSENEVPQEMLDKEKEIYTAQALDSGKPAEIAEKMVAGRLKKFLKEITLLGQPFVKDPDQTVENILKSGAASVNGFTRFEVGEGLEKKSENFADEVMAQIKG